MTEVVVSHFESVDNRLLVLCGWLVDRIFTHHHLWCSKILSSTVDPDIVCVAAAEWAVEVLSLSLSSSGSTVVDSVGTGGDGGGCRS